MSARDLDMFFPKARRPMLLVRKRYPRAESRMLPRDNGGIAWQIWNDGVRLDSGLHFRSEDAWRSLLETI